MLKTLELGNNQHKQELVNALANATSWQAEKIEVRTVGERKILISTFGKGTDLEKQKKLAEFCVNDLKKMGVFTQPPSVSIEEGNTLKVVFFQKSSFDGPMFMFHKHGQSQRNNPAKNLNPLLSNRKKAKSNKNRNHSNRSLDDLVETVEITEAEAERFTVGDYNEDEIWADLDRSQFDRTKYEDEMKPFNPFAVAAKTPSESEKATADKKQPSVKQFLPRKHKDTGFKFLRAVAKQYTFGSRTDKHRKSKLNRWAHLMAAVGLVSQNQIIAGMDRLQNDTGTTPCSISYACRVIAGTHKGMPWSDKDLTCPDGASGRFAVKCVDGQFKAVAWIDKKNRKVGYINQATGSKHGMYSASKVGASNAANAAMPLVSEDGQYLGIRWK